MLDAADKSAELIERAKVAIAEERWADAERVLMELTRVVSVLVKMVGDKGSMRPKNLR